MLRRSDGACHCRSGNRPPTIALTWGCARKKQSCVSIPASAVRRPCRADHE